MFNWIKKFSSMECVLYCIELWLLSSRAVTLSTYCLYVVAPWSLNFWYLLQELILTFLFIHSLFNILLLHKCSFQSSPSPFWTRQIVATFGPANFFEKTREYLCFCRYLSWCLSFQRRQCDIPMSFRFCDD